MSETLQADGIAAPVPALFAADLHLSVDRPATAAAFLAFLRGPATRAGSLWILGDLFESWPGDDDLDAPLHQSVCAALHTLAERGVKTAFMHGNRDLLIGDAFARATGATLISDPCEITVDGRRLLLSHGDALCTGDHAYQTYRQQVHDPEWQAGFLALPLDERKAIIESLRLRSETAKQAKSMAIMDVSPEAVTDLLRAHGLPTLIHGHTHRPARHEHHVDGQICERWVLAEWRDAATWLEFSGGQLTPRGQYPA